MDGGKAPSAAVAAATGAATAAASPLYVSYKLRDESNAYAVLASDGLPCAPMTSIAELRRAVFAANPNRLRGVDYLALDVYPPGTGDAELADHGAARHPSLLVSSLLPAATEQDRKKRRSITVARPPFPGARGQGEQFDRLDNTARCAA